VDPRGVSILPKDTATDAGPGESRSAITDIPAGTGLFGPEWSPKIGAKVFMGDGTRWAPIPYEYGPTDQVASRSRILIVTPRARNEIEWVHFENKPQGRVIVKLAGEATEYHVAKVIQPVLGTGRFVGSEFIRKPGVLRANHAGVFCVGTTDKNVDPAIPAGTPINELRGGFQILPSHHYQDPSMSSGGDHGFVYMVVGPIQDPVDLVRYDRGIDGQYPLFRNGFRAGGGRTEMRFQGDAKWYELQDAVKAGRFRRADGTVIQHLRGVIPDAFREVTDIRFHTGAGEPKTAETETTEQLH